jgi:two-component system response regulator VicR
MGNEQATILLVEDDHDIRVTIRHALEDSSYRVLSAPNGRDALKILNKERPALIILDMVMPLMDGEEFLKAISRDDRLRNLPVIQISAHADKLSFTPPNVAIKKPLDMDQFLQQIPQLLQKTLA